MELFHSLHENFTRHVKNVDLDFLVYCKSSWDKDVSIVTRTQCLFTTKVKLMIFMVILDRKLTVPGESKQEEYQAALYRDPTHMWRCVHPCRVHCYSTHTAQPECTLCTASFLSLYKKQSFLLFEIKPLGSQAGSELMTLQSHLPTLRNQSLVPQHIISMKKLIKTHLTPSVITS